MEPSHKRRKGRKKIILILSTVLIAVVVLVTIILKERDNYFSRESASNKGQLKTRDDNSIPSDDVFSKETRRNDRQKLALVKQELAEKVQIAQKQLESGELVPPDLEDERDLAVAPLFPDGGLWENGADHLERVLQKQKANEEWSASVQEEGTKFLYDIELESIQIKSVDCRETMCKVSLKFGSEKDASSFRTDVLTVKAPWNGENFGSIEEDEQGTPIGAKMYFAPNGFPR